MFDCKRCFGYTNRTCLLISHPIAWIFPTNWTPIHFNTNQACTKNWYERKFCPVNLPLQKQSMIILVTYEITYTGGYWNLTAWAVYLVQLHRLDCYTNQLDCYKVNKITGYFSYFMLLLNFSSNAFYFILFDNLQAFFWQYLLSDT